MTPVVIPANAGIPAGIGSAFSPWDPASAGVTGRGE